MNENPDGLRRVLAWYDKLSQSEKDAIRAEAKEIGERARERTRIRIAEFDKQLVNTKSAEAVLDKILAQRAELLRRLSD